jgi:hypothetical protein
MCGSADSSATIRGNTTLEQERRARSAAGLPPPAPTTSAAGFQDNAFTMQGFSIAPPKDAPSITDTLVRQRRASEMTRLTAGRGRRDSFLGGGEGGYGARSSSLLGGG